MRHRRLVIFVREPLPGRVKSRLAADIGRIDACWWYRRQCRRLLRAVAADPRWETVLAVTPDRAAPGRFWPSGLARTGQGAGDLGRRMARALRRGPGDVLIVGSDIPGITPARIAETFACLGPRDAVLAPAEDGGYWAIGRRSGAVLPARALERVRWSTRHTGADSVASLAPLSVGLGPVLADVDCAADLARPGGGRGGTHDARARKSPAPGGRSGAT
ncbi:MAG TPA: DUF2064 domain-containing protein [Thermohalobaculum sp.]|nr:DUF2064 domain-containing protein [Thermohalobaculum sp.]